MKKTILTVVLISGLAVATVASANWGRGGGRGMNNGVCPQGQYSQQVDPAVQEKMNAFNLETQALRKDLAMKVAEQRAMMNGTNPDPAAVAKLTGEIFDMRTVMRDKAVAAGVDQYMGPRGGGYGQGMGANGGGRGGRMMQGGGSFQ